MFESSETGRIFPFDLIGKFAISPIFPINGVAVSAAAEEPQYHQLIIIC